MGLIRDYIKENYGRQSITEMADDLRRNKETVRSITYRMGMKVIDDWAVTKDTVKIEPVKPIVHKKDYFLEQYRALTYFIKQHKQGILVDIAKRRQQDIEELIQR